MMEYALLWLSWLALAGLMAWLLIGRPIAKELREVAYELKRIGIAIGAGEPDHYSAWKAWHERNKGKAKR